MGISVTFVVPILGKRRQPSSMVSFVFSRASSLLSLVLAFHFPRSDFVPRWGSLTSSLRLQKCSSGRSFFLQLLISHLSCTRPVLLCPSMSLFCMSYLSFSISVLPNNLLVTVSSPFSLLFVHPCLFSPFCPISCILPSYLFFFLLWPVFCSLSYSLLSEISLQSLLCPPLNIFSPTLFLCSLSLSIPSPNFHLHIYMPTDTYVYSTPDLPFSS